MNLTNSLYTLRYNIIVFVLPFVSAYILPTYEDFDNNNKKTWIDAETYCQSAHNSHLLSIHDSFTFSQIRAEIHAIGKDSEDFWIGLVNTNPNLTNGGQPKYEWSDSTPFNYGTDLSGRFPWFDERPEAPSIDTKVRLWGGSASLLWDDTPETNKYYWVCNDSPTTLSPTMFPTVSPISTTISPTKNTNSGVSHQQKQTQTTSQIGGGGGGGAVIIQPATDDEMDDINLFWKLAIIAVLIFSLCVLAYLCHTKLNDAWARFKENLSIQQISHSFSTRVQSLSQQFNNYRNRRYTSDSRIMEEIAATRRPGHHRGHHRKPPPPPRATHKRGGYEMHRNFSTPANSPFPDSAQQRMRMMNNRLQVPPKGHNYDQTETVISTPTIATVQGQSTTLKSHESAPSSMLSMGSNSLGPPEPNTQPPSNDLFDELPIKLTSPTVKLSLSNTPYKKHHHEQNDSEFQIAKKRLPGLVPNSQSSYHQYNHDIPYDDFNDEEEGSLNERARRQYYTTPKGEDKVLRNGKNTMHEIHESKSTIFDGGVMPNSRLLRDVSFNVDEYKRHHEEKQNHTMIQPIHALLIKSDNGKYSITPNSGDDAALIYEQDENKKDIISPPRSSTNKRDKLSPSNANNAHDHDITDDEVAAHSVYVAGRILAHKYIMDKLANDHENWSNASLTSGEEDTVNGPSVFSPIGNKAYNTMSVGLKRFDSKILEDLHEESQFDGDTLTKLPYGSDDDGDIIDDIIDEMDDIDAVEDSTIKGQQLHDAMEEEEDLDDDAALTIIMSPGRQTRGPSASTNVKTEIYRGDTEHYIELTIAPETTDGETQDDEDDDDEEDDDEDDDDDYDTVDNNGYSHSDAVGHFRDETYTMN